MVCCCLSNMHVRIKKSVFHSEHTKKIYIYSVDTSKI